MAGAVSLKKLTLKNPFIASSGTCGYADADLIPLDKFGAAVTKTITLLPRQGNRPPRLVETPAGLVNSIGLQNMGLEAFKQFLTDFKKPTTLIVSVGGESPEDFATIVEELNTYDLIDAFELNLSCPNVKMGGEVVGKDYVTVSNILEASLKSTTKPLLVKLSPFTEQLDKILQHWESKVEAFVLFNTFPAMDIDPRSGKPVLGAVSGGLSGPAIYPIVLNSIYKYSKAHTLVASGGIATTDIAKKFIMAGARALEIGTGNLWNPAFIEMLLKEV